MGDKSTPKRKDKHGLMVRERQILVLTRDHPEASGSEMARTLDISRARMSQLRNRLIEKGMLDEEFRLTEAGADVIGGS